MALAEANNSVLVKEKVRRGIMTQGNLQNNAEVVNNDNVVRSL